MFRKAALKQSNLSDRDLADGLREQELLEVPTDSGALRGVAGQRGNGRQMSLERLGNAGNVCWECHVASRVGPVGRAISW